jgi:chaperonin cofactor prefoldin
MMQMTLEDMLSFLMARIDSIAMSEESLKTKFDVLGRVLYKKGIITDDDIVESVREQGKLMKAIGVTQAELSDEEVRAIADNIIVWLKGDAATIKKSMEEYEQRLRELASQEMKKPRLDVASPAVLSELDKITKGGKSGGKLIM